MFLCEKCHTNTTCIHLTHSYGHCEYCNKIEICVDCRADQPPKKIKKVRRKKK